MIKSTSEHKYKVYDSATSNVGDVAGESQVFENADRVQVDYTGSSATEAEIFGRLHAKLPWVSLTGVIAITELVELYIIPMMPEQKITFTGGSTEKAYAYNSITQGGCQ